MSRGVFVLAAGGTGGHLFPAQALAEELIRESTFFKEFILDCPQDKALSISRATVMEWLARVGKHADFEERRRSVAERLANRGVRATAAAAAGPEAGAATARRCSWRSSPSGRAASRSCR